MRVDEVDARHAPEALLRAVHEAFVEALADRFDGEPPPPFEQALGLFRHPTGGERFHWVATEEAHVLGSASLAVFGPAFTWVDLTVRPSARRRGVGKALLEPLVARARERGVVSMFGHHSSPAGAAFAARAGARDDQREVRSRLALRRAELPEPVVPAGVELRSWIGRTPDGLLDSHVRARDAMDDAPVPEGTAHPGWSLAQQQEMEASAIERGRPPRVTVAIEGGEIVAFTDLRVSPPPAALALTDDTATVPSARGRGLATAVKLESLRRLRADRPDVELVATLNAEQNAAIRAVNAKIGFLPVRVLTTTVLEL